MVNEIDTIINNIKGDLRNIRKEYNDVFIKYYSNNATYEDIIRLDEKYYQKMIDLEDAIKIKERYKNKIYK